MFAEVLTRLEAQLAKVDRAEAREAKRRALARARKARGGGGRTTPKKATKRTSSAKAKGTPTGPKEFQDEAANAARNRGKIASPRNKAISAHVGARGRRSQAKRDSR